MARTKKAGRTRATRKAPKKVLKSKDFFLVMDTRDCVGVFDYQPDLPDGEFDVFDLDDCKLDICDQFKEITGLTLEPRDVVKARLVVLKRTRNVVKTETEVFEDDE